MVIKHMGWLWANSATVCGRSGISVLKRRIVFFVRAIAAYKSVRPMIVASPESPLGELIRQRPETIGAVIWPYQCISWNTSKRLDRIRDHYSIVGQMGKALVFPIDGEVQLLNLAYVRDGLRVIIDQPTWFMREGQLSINLFVGDTRMYTLAFSFFHHENEIAAFIGAIQGRDIEGALEEYRELTKASHGMRPRDLTIEIFRMFCEELNVARLFAVSDAFRHHRDRYFGKEGSTKQFSSNYDDIWRERGGKPVSSQFYELDVHSHERELASISSKKRAMYRRRFDMLRRIKSELKSRCSDLGIASTRRAI